MSLNCTWHGTLLRLTRCTASYNEIRSASTFRKYAHTGSLRSPVSLVRERYLRPLDSDEGDLSPAPELHALHRAIRRRSQNMVLNHLQELSVSGSVHLLGDIDLEAVARVLKPYNHFNTPRSHSARSLYHQRMAYFRKWLIDSGRIVPISVWFLLLEECRLELIPERREQRADQTWSSMLESGAKPNTYCYNSYIAAKCAQPADYDRLRLRKRSDSDADRDARDMLLQQAQVQVQAAVVVYRQMIRDGIQPNSMTVDLLILALGKAGNLDALRSLLHQTWNISLPDPAFEPLQGQGVPDEYEEEGLNLEDNPMENTKQPRVGRSSSLYPTQATMRSLAMAYGANSQNLLALYAVRSLANTYSLKISDSVWTELLKWASIDSAHLGGYTSVDRVGELFQMSRTEYGTRPSISMYYLAAKHSLHSNRNPEQVFVLASEMLRSVEGELSLQRPKYRAGELYPHARAVALKLFHKVKTGLQAPLAKLERKYKLAEANAAIERSQFLESDIERRKKHLLHTIQQWTQRICQYDSRMRTMIIEQRVRLTNHRTENDSMQEEDQSPTELRQSIT